MKLQSFTVIFAIIIIPISLVLSAYIQTHIDTIVLQTSYDTKLSNATYDSIKSFQLNTVNSKYSSVSDSKMRDIEASINTFFNSLGTNIGLDGYSQNVLKTYVPALVFTLYDGYYIYSPYENTETGKYIHGLKPYIYYTCRYVDEVNNRDVVINYTLDNYIVVYAKLGTNYVTKAGYLINTDELNINGDNVTYKGVKIDTETLKESLLTSGDTKAKEYTYVYNNGEKYYYDAISNGGDNKWFKYLTSNFTKQKMNNSLNAKDSSAINYYKEAKTFTDWVTTNLSWIRPEHAVNVSTKDSEGNIVELFEGDNSQILAIGKNNDPEDMSAVFNEHRREVIKHSIQTNLNSAIANYNENSQAADTTYNFKIPIITEEEWDKILNNICVISFLQGLPIGNKYYNNYCIISNSVNKEYVSPTSIEVVAGDGNHHLFGCSELFKSPTNGSLIGYSNINFVRQTVEVNEQLKYYYPHENINCYKCIVDSKALYELEDILNNDTINIDGTNYSTQNLRKAYYQAYAREKYNLYKTNDYLNDNAL